MKETILLNGKNNTLGVIQADKYDDFYPNEGTLIGAANLQSDALNSLKVRGAVLTDEVSFRDDFSGVVLDTTEWTETLISGATGTVSNSEYVLSSGTTTGLSSIVRIGDYCPMTFRARMKVGARNANQQIVLGFVKRNAGIIEKGVYFLLDGTNSSEFKCVSQSSSSVSDTQSKTVTYLEDNSTEYLYYKIDVSNTTASFSVSNAGDNYYLAAQYQLHLPGPYDLMDLELSVNNTGATSNTDVYLDMVFLNNMNRVQTDDDFTYEPAPTTIHGVTDRGNLVPINSTVEGHLEVAVHGPRLPFGSIHAEKLTPIFQHDAVYGIKSNAVRTTASLTGTATAVDANFRISTGTTAFSQASIQSRKRLRYRAGQGVVGRFAGRFTTGVADSYQVAGFGHAEDGVYFGYKGTEFGILYVNRGVREVQTLTITTASSTTQNITVTLAGTAYSVAVTNSANIQRTVWEISQGTYDGWQCYPSGATVVFVANDAGNKTGTFSISGTTVVGAFAETKAGAADTELFVPQTSWNGDKMDGNGPTGSVLDPTKGNVFQIGIQYLGYGSISFAIEVDNNDSNNPEFVTVHTLKFPNTLTTTSFRNPSFPFTMAVYSAGSTTNLEINVGSFAGFIEGEKMLHGGRFTYVNQLASVGSASYTPLFTIMNKQYYSGMANQSIINLLNISGAVEHNNPVIFYLIRNGSLTGNPSFQDYSTNSCSVWDTAATGVTFTNGEQLVWTGHIGSVGEFDHHFGNGSFNAEEFTLQPGDWVTLAVRSTSAATQFVTGSINTREDQ